MSKPTLDEFESTGDPMLDDNFEIIFSNLPVDGMDGAKSLRIHTKTGTLPGATIEEVIKEAFGYQLRYAGRKTFSGSFQMEFNENHQAKILKIMRKWHAKIRTTKTALGRFKKEYAATVTFRLLDQTGAMVDETTIKGVWPGQVPDYQFSGAAQAVPCSIDFKFDYILTDAD
jgi:hypothetical protein